MRIALTIYIVLVLSLSTGIASDAQTEFVSLFDGKSFAGWEHGGNWTIEDGAFYRKADGGSLTYTKALVPDDFELRFEWKVSKGCNSGVYYRPAQYEYQILDNVHSPYGANPRQAAGSLFFCMAPSKDTTKPLGQWNTGRVKCKGTIIEHWVNGERVLSFDYTDPKWSTQVDLLNLRGADLDARGGNLWLQDHGQPVWFRSLQWREIPESEALIANPDFTPMPVTGEALKQENDRVKRMLEAQHEKTSN
ncbi:MAG: 3-keto-disaccharide hydrolase [Verrucomicrobiia bacterium]